jgi:hypothetical protein
MTGKFHLKVNGFAVASLALALGLIACSSASTDPGLGGDTSSSSSGSSSGSSSSGGRSSSGSSSGTSSGASSGTASSGGSSSGASSSGASSSGASSGSSGSGSSSGSTSSGSSSGSSSSSGGSGSSSGGTTTTLAPPAAGTGLQIVTPDYNASDPNAKNMIVQPGQEIFLCYYVTLPNSQVEVGSFQSLMSAGSSHHFIVFQQGGQGAFSLPQANGTIVSCPFGTGQWIYATSTPGEVVSMSMPSGVGYPFPASTQIVLNMHFINAGSTVLYPKVTLNINYATNVQYQAAAMVSFNTKISVPPGTATNPGTQTVSGTCTAPVGSKFFIMSTHTHKHATAAIVDYIHNGTTTEIVHTGATTTYPVDQESGTGTDWEHPGVGQWTAPNFLTTTAGDSFKYSCTYQNTDATTVTVGETAASNEMCMSIGYYFPAGTTSCN